MANIADIVVYSGEDITVKLTVYQADGVTVQDITGWTITLTVTGQFSKSGSITSAAGGLVSFTLASADTASLAGGYRYRIFRANTGADTVLVAGGFLVL